jgi:hypothetical protein
VSLIFRAPLRNIGYKVKGGDGRQVRTARPVETDGDRSDRTELPRRFEQQTVLQKEEWPSSIRFTGIEQAVPDIITRGILVFSTTSSYVLGSSPRTFS